METTKNQMPPYAQMFFNKLSSSLDLKLYYFGSIQRKDYFPNSSDIDVDIFTPNEKSTIYQLQHYLNIQRKDIKKFIYKLQKKNNIVTGYKINVKVPEHNFFTELSIYNEYYKEDIILEHTRKSFLPWYITTLLVIVKYMYYNLNILPDFIYKKLKKFLIQYCIDGKEADFIIVDIKENED